MKDNFYFELNWGKMYRNPTKTASFQLSFPSLITLSTNTLVKGFEAKKCTRLLFIVLAWAVFDCGGQVSGQMKPATSLASTAAFYLLIFLKYRVQKTVVQNMILRGHELKLLFTFLKGWGKNLQRMIFHNILQLHEI